MGLSGKFAGREFPKNFTGMQIAKEGVEAHPSNTTVIAGLVPAIHATPERLNDRMDHRDFAR